MTQTPNRGYELPVKTDLKTSFDNVVAAFSAVDLDVAAIISALMLRATTNSPIFTGEPKAPTQEAGNASALLATTQFVANALATFSPPNISADSIASGTLPDARLSFQVSSFIRTLLVAADAASARGVLQLDTLLALLATKANPTFTGTVTLGQDPAAALQAVTKQYVDNLALNVGRRGRVRVASTANINLAAPGAAIDSVTMAAGYLFLAKNQTTASQNGIYVWNGAATAATRFSEFDTYDEHPGSLIAIEEGTVNADTLWICTSNDGGTLGTTAITFSSVALAILDASVTFAKLAAAAIATAAEYRTGTATGKLLTTDQVNAAMAEATLTDAATIAWDMATGIDFTVTLTAAVGATRALGNPTNCVPGRRGRIRVVQPATGGPCVLTKSANHKTAGAAAISLSTAANAVDYIDYDCRSATDVRLSASRSWA